MRFFWILALVAAGCGDGSFTVPISGSDAGRDDVAAVDVPDVTATECTTATDCPAADHCSGSYVCVDGQCVIDEATVPTPCVATACHTASCDPDTGACVQTAVADGSACDLAGSCDGACQTGVCQGPLKIRCDQRHTAPLGASFSTNRWSAYGCPGIDAGQALPTGSETVYAFTAEADQTITLALSAAAGVADLYVLRGCGPDACKDAPVHGDGALDVTVAKGETLLLAVEPGAASGGEYTLSVVCDTSTCVPNCDITGATCDPDGCGGECAPGCQENEECSDEHACVPIVSADVCKVATPVVTSVSGTTATASDDYAIAADNKCGVPAAFGAGGRDVVHSFTPTEPGAYELTLTSTFAASLYVATDCKAESSTCMGATQVAPALPGTLVLWLTQGTTYYVFIDGQSATDHGKYTLEVTKPSGAPATFDTIDAVPKTIDGVLGNVSAWSVGPGVVCGAQAHASPYGLGPEKVYAFKPAKDGPVTATLTQLEFDASLYITTFLPAVKGKCLGSAASILKGDVELTQDFTAGVTYYIVVDSGAGASGGFRLTVTQAVPGHQYNDCDTPATLTLAAPVAGNTTGGKDKFTPPQAGTCSVPQWSLGAPDEIAKFDAPAGPKTYRFKVESKSATYKPGLYVLDKCLESTNVEPYCHAEAKPAGGDPASVLVKALGGESFFVIVDGKDATEGTYTLTVDECVPQCEGKTCGDDGCLGLCGPECPEGAQCHDGKCVPPPVNDLCAGATAIGTPPWTVTDDTLSSNDDYQLASAACSAAEGDLSSGGLGAYDEVYVFTPPETALYTISLAGWEAGPGGAFDGLLVVSTSCPAIASGCMVAANSHGVGSAAEEITLSLQQGQPYYIVVDGAQAGQAGAYKLTVAKK